MEFLNKLPVSAHFQEIKEKWSQTGSFAIKAPTGSGKSLGIPLLLLNERLVKGRILIVQPRRVAARNLAKVASNFNRTDLGHEIGYKVRFDSRVSQKTKIIYLTDGMLFRLLQNPESLVDVELLIFDEFHERTLFMDASLALAKFYTENKKISAKILITSATLDLEKASRYLGAPNGLELLTKVFPIDIIYQALKQDENLPSQICGHLRGILRRHEGDILIFMDGVAEIRRTVREIQNRLGGNQLAVFPLYGEMSHDSQDLAFAPSEKRKIIVSTNLAETSLTIEGIKIVIDTGLAKKHRFDPYRKVNVLLSEPISRSSAQQRAGRAGRLSPGICLRMWSQNEHTRRKEFDEPEIHRLDLSEIYLNLKAIDVNPNDLDWYESPPEKQLIEAEKFLVSIDAIDSSKQVLPLGNELAKLPLHPRIGFALLVAKETQCLSEFALVSAALDYKSPIDYEKREDFLQRDYPRSDLCALITAYNSARTVHFAPSECKKIGVHGLRFREISESARMLCNSLGEKFIEPKEEFKDLAKILLKIYPDKLAYLENKGTNVYRDFSGLSLQLAKGSTVRGAEWVLPLKVLEKKNKGRIILEMDEVTAVQENEIRACMGEKIETQEDVYLDIPTHQVFVRRIEKVGEVVLRKKESSEVSEKQRVRAYAEAILQGSLKLKNWNVQVTDFLSRINFLASLYSEFEIQPFDEDAERLVVQKICSSSKKWKEIKNTDIIEFIRSFYGQEKVKLLEQAVPAKFHLNNQDKPVSLRYEKNKVYLQAPIQRFYDTKEHPTIVFGQCVVMLELLAPNGRVVQCTDDIIGFWERSYPAIKKELAGRYPKHDWK